MSYELGLRMYTHINESIVIHYIVLLYRCNRESAKYIIIFILTKIGMYDTLVLYLGRTKDST